MTVSDVVAYLFGKRSAIERIATCPQAVLLGLAFVISAGFAREYDGEDLLHEPWHLALPLAASLTTSLVLYCLLHGAASQHASSRVAFLPTYRRFLALYWMTAPLAWIYAIPVERMTDPGQATRFNLGFLALVSLWRVLLITRSSAVLFGASFWSMFFPVMLFADTLASLIVWFTPLPVFNIMGGIRLSESEAVILDTAFTVRFFGAVTWPFWLIGSWVVASRKRNWEPLQGHGEPISRPVWLLAALSVLIWSVVLPYTQPAQRLRWTVENDLAGGRIQNAVEVMSSHPRDAFPPHWDPPPWPGYGQDDPRLIDVLEAITDTPSTAEWVRSLYVQKFLQQTDAEFLTFHIFDSMEDDEFGRYLAILEQTPETHEFVRKNKEILANLVERESPKSEARERQLDSLFQTAGIRPVEDQADEAGAPASPNVAAE